MKKSLLALAALTAFAGAASAQSSVTLFGIVDLNLRSTDNGGSAGEIRSLSQDGLASSRIGLRGVEDLGGGLRAGFWLEGAINPDTGTPGGQTWQRRSTLSLIGGFGEVRLGRDYTPTFWNHTIFDPFGTNGVGAQTNLQTQQGQTTMLGSGATTLVRANNSIGYFLPSMGGLYGQVMVAAAEGPANGNKYMGFRLGYGAGPVNVAFAWGTTEATATVDLDAWNVGASYNLGFMTLMGQYHVYEAGAAEQKNAMLGVTVPMGAGTFKASYGKASGDVDQIAVGYVYDLSKRTALYGTFSRIGNGTGKKFVVPGGATVTTLGQNSQGYEFGVRHSF
jgi:predicted porin